jgi:hypothetical protein
VLLDPCAPGAAAGLVASLLPLDDWHLLRPARGAPGGGAWTLLKAWPGPCVVLPASSCLEQPGAPAEQVLAGLPPKQRHEWRRQARRADELGLRSAVVPPEPATIAAAVTEMLDLHGRQWSGRPVTRCT